MRGGQLVGAQSARFEIRPPFVVFCDNRPGNNAVMRVGDRQLAFRADASRFDNERRAYAWAFEGEIVEGDVVTFFADDRVVAGQVYGGKVLLRGVGVGGSRKPTAPPAPLPPSPAHRFSQASRLLAPRSPAPVGPAALPSVAEVLASPAASVRRPAALSARRFRP